MTIQITELNYNTIACNHTYTNDWGMKKSFNGFKVKETSGKKVYITVLSGETKLTTIGKLMEFKQGSITIKFGKNQIVIGKYNVVE